MHHSPASDRPTQQYLGDRGLIVLIALLSAFVPLSTDLYLPALPGMGDYFGVSATLTNLTLILFFLFFSLGLLFWGPLSDRYGRRPVLLVGLALYIAASAGCAVSWEIWHLIAFRILQAVGGSAASAVAMAMVKDVYDGRKRESVLALVQSMVVISPAVAPVLGAFMLPYTSWRGLFVALAIIGVVSMAGGLLLRETIPSRYNGTMAQSVRRLGVVLKNPGFTSLLVVFSLVSTASLAFVSASSYIYQDAFGLSEQWYSFYFALNAVGLIAGPFLYLWLSRHASRRSIVASGFVVMIGAGLLVCLFGGLGPLAFALALFPASLMGSAVRPGGAFLMLDQQKEDTGSASALINCAGLVFGSAGMVLVFLFGNSLVFGLGAINVAAGVACLLGWAAIGKRGLVRF
ncbi:MULTISPECIES: Bcr/CflA family efflux MFS transporter [Methanoculleus]|uniref:Drug resistance transporter, Bcr/CflA subfamily n=2 Tax=Methanoculleus TaxID=45989 RepID=A3CW77_METMJ|nr:MULTISPECIES: Bcr/CflA family efflux MFS transporter [Methanoculleus]ABN57627.1 drug resistance transporter, Bcr/CflA subfamily [Methanoculleus marisnigri JR1]UYU19024.1 Bcr/CflA family efflux MFS transporter [Methanoculleus submarinus]